jgi:very-short-patch-repair endonuclease
MPSITELCRELRQRQTPAETLLWNQLRNRKLLGKKFLRQHPIFIKSVQGLVQCYIPDFYCAEANLIVEADGPVHLYKRDYDKNRDAVLSELGLHILRFENKQIEDDMGGVLEMIKLALDK